MAKQHREVATIPCFAEEEPFTRPSRYSKNTILFNHTATKTKCWV